MRSALFFFFRGFGGGWYQVRQREAGPGCLGKPTHIARTLAVFCKDA